MAVDTRDKRFSMLGLGLDFLRVRPNPDGAVGTEDRLHFLPLYRGIAAAAANPATADVIVLARRWVSIVRATK